MINAYHKFARLCYRVLRVLACITMIAMLVLMMTEVVRRYLFEKTFIWGDEIIRYLLIYCTFLGGACAYYNKALVGFDLLTSRLPHRTQELLKLINNCICLVFFVFLLIQAFKKVTGPAVVRSISTASGLSLAVPYWAIPIGIFFMLIFTIDFFPDMISNVRKAYGKKAKADPDSLKEGEDAC